MTRKVLHSVSVALICIAVLMPVLAFLGYVLELYGPRYTIYVFATLCWKTVAALLVLIGIFLIVNSAAKDTCQAMDKWAQHPQAETAPSKGYLFPQNAAGCTVVLKPSELVSLTCLELGAKWEEIGLPPGVLNIITGLGPEAGAPLASHHRVDRIVFTGSTETGKRRMTAAAQMVKPVSLELGGKGPLIVFDDEAESQGRENFVKETDIVVADVVMAIVADFMLVYLPVPIVSLQPPFATNAGHMATFFHKCPDNAFQMALTGGSYSLLHRLGAILRNGAKLFAVGTSAFLIGTGVTNALSKARTAVDKELDDKIEDIPMVSTSVAYGIYMAVSSNLRYQVLAGVIEQRIELDAVTYGVIVNCLCRFGKQDEAVACFRNCVEKGVAVNAIFNASLIDGFGKAGIVDQAQEYFEEMTVKGFVPDSYYYNVLIDGLAKAGRMDGACALYKRMEDDGCDQTVYTYTILIDGVQVRLGIDVILIPWDPGGNDDESSVTA